MKHLLPPERREETLRTWRGGRAKLWLYHITLRTLALRVERPGEREVLYIVGNSCENIHGPFVWPDANITITDSPDPATGENVCVVSDATVGFELRCSTAALATGPADEMDTSFDNFLGQGPVRA